MTGKRAGWRSAVSVVVGVLLLANAPSVALVLTREDPSSDFQRGFLYLYASLGVVVALVTTAARVVFRAARRALPLVTRRLVASSLAIGMLFGWPWPAASELRDAPRTTALLVNTIALLAALVWWIVEVRRDTRAGAGRSGGEATTRSST